MAESKLYPPLIEGTLPAFYGNTLKVPFTMNRAVSDKDYVGFALKIKHVQGNSSVFTDTILVRKEEAFRESEDFIIHFNLPSQHNLTPGQHYKVQVAYYTGSNNTPQIGYYSTVATAKYTYKPTVEIAKLKKNAVNVHTYDYTGVYSQQGKDTSEKVYSYCFNFYDSNKQLLKTSGEQIHNNANDTEIYESSDEYSVNEDLVLNEIYFIEYVVTTINRLRESSGLYKVSQQKTLNPTLDVKIIPNLNFENGYIDLNLVGAKDTFGVEKPASGSFKMVRASSEDGFVTWSEITRFSLFNQPPSKYVWRDYTVKQGVYYKYGIQQYNSYNLSSNRIESNMIYSDFEHAYLFDGKRQLKIKFNPKVSSFKNTLLESKMDTIGSKHPFIFRNGNVNYKEFPISGLISCLTDEDFLFVNGTKSEPDKRTQTHENPLTRKKIWEENLVYYEKMLEQSKTAGDVLRWEAKIKLAKENILVADIAATAYDYTVAPLNTDLSDDNIYKERNFKLEVLDWLTNGEVKLFRSPAEGNYIVRLLNVSLSPNDTVGRMLHTFNCTAYEVAEYTHENLVSNNFLQVVDPTVKQLRWETVKIDENSSKKSNLLSYKAVSLYFENMIPGDRIYINDGVYREDLGMTGFIASIGITGSYNVDLRNGVEVSEVRFVDSINTRHQGTLTYGYYSLSSNHFNDITNIEVQDIPLQQYFGEYDNILEYYDAHADRAENGMSTLTEMPFQDIRTTLTNIYYLRFWSRRVLPAYRRSDLPVRKILANGSLLTPDEMNKLFMMNFDAYNMASQDAVSGMWQVDLMAINAALKDYTSKYYTDTRCTNEVEFNPMYVYKVNEIYDNYYGQVQLRKIGDYEELDKRIIQQAFNYPSLDSMSADERELFEAKYAEETGNLYYSYLDGNDLTAEKVYGSYLPIVWINDRKNEHIDLEKTYNYTVRHPQNINKITLGNGAICEIVYQRQILSQNFEEFTEFNENHYAHILDAKRAFLNKQEEIHKYLFENRNNADFDYETKYNELLIAYHNYLYEVEEEKIKREEQQGDTV